MPSRVEPSTIKVSFHFSNTSHPFDKKEYIFWDSWKLADILKRVEEEKKRYESMFLFALNTRPPF